MNDNKKNFPFAFKTAKNIYEKRYKLEGFMFTHSFFFFIPLLTALSGYAEGTAAVKDVSEKLLRGFLRIDSLFILKESSLCFRNNSKWRYLE